MGAKGQRLRGALLADIAAHQDESRAVGRARKPQAVLEGGHDEGEGRAVGHVLVGGDDLVAEIFELHAQELAGGV